MEQSNKKLIALVALAALVMMALGFFVLMRNRAAPPSANAPRGAAPPPEQPLSAEDKMQILQGLATEKISAAERRSMLRMLMK